VFPPPRKIPAMTRYAFFSGLRPGVAVRQGRAPAVELLGFAYN
jgi:hypothetical protein